MNTRKQVARWQQRQQQILKQTYVQAWQTGAKNYRSQQATPLQGMTTVTPPPVGPAPAAMAAALASAMASLSTMAAGLNLVVPVAGQTVQAAMSVCLLANAWRLAGAVSVAWAGEQAGYAQTAASDGLLLSWQLDPAVKHHCADCPALASLPPMPLNQWPTLPGEGATECSVGCKCSMVAVSAAPVGLTAVQHQIVQKVGSQLPALVAA